MARKQLVNFVSSSRQCLGELNCLDAKTELEAAVGEAESRKKNLDARNREGIEGGPDHARAYAILRSIPGIGAAAAAGLLCWMPELGTVGSRQGRHSPHRRRPRDLLFMAATAASRFNAESATFYARLVEREKSTTWRLWRR